MPDWDAPAATPADIGDAEVVLKIDSGDSIDATVNVQVVDADGNEIERRYARGRAAVEALLTQGQAQAIEAILGRVRDKGREDLIP